MSSSTSKALDAKASKTVGSSSSGSGLEDAGLDSVALPMSGMHTVQSSPASGAQIRSRITVVCAECKRLKLRCDRRTPCGSCVKRDTVSRCHYSAAAAEKIDVQSLHNRVLILEAQLAAVQSNPAIVSYTGHGVHINYDRALLAVGQSGSSLTISLDDISAIWLDELDLMKDGIELQPAVQQMPRDVGPSAGNMLETLMEYGPCFRLAPSEHSGSDVGVTPELIARLPKEPLRSQLMDQLESALLMHPCINFPQFKTLVATMFHWADNASRARNSELVSSRRPSLSFFAATATGFALGAQCQLEAHAAMSTTDVAGPSSAPDNTLGFNSRLPHALISLATFALDLHLDHHAYSAYDLDYLYALNLKVMYLLHAYPGPGLSHELFPLVGKMVNTARMMGLSVDPDEMDCSQADAGPSKVKREEGTGRLSLYDKEMRRRLWWDVFTTDLFISDYMDIPPLISDDTHTTRLPTDVDETTFNAQSTMLPPPNDENQHGNIGFFVQKCRLARLVKNMKKRTFRDPTSATNDLSIDQAVMFDAEIQQWLNELPEKYKLNMDLSWSNADPLPASFSPNTHTPSPPLSSTNAPLPSSTNTSQSDTTVVESGSIVSPFLVAQRCELASIANRMLLKLYLPFLKNARYNNGVQLKPPQQAILATANAAHIIVHASRVLHMVLRHAFPATYVFYSFARTLFDAAVICAHNTIQQPNTIYARVAMEDVTAALLVLRDPMVSTGRGPVRGGVENSPSEAVRIVELLKSRAEAAIKGAGAGVNAGTKRKHAEVDSSNLATYKGFHLPFVGGGVVSAGPRQSYVPPTTVPESDGGSGARINTISSRASAPSIVSKQRDHTRAKHDTALKAQPRSDTPSSSAGGKVPTHKERPSKAQSSVHYPSIGIRVRSESIKNDATQKQRRDSAASSRHSGTPMPPPQLQSSPTTVPSSLVATTEASPTYHDITAQVAQQGENVIEDAPSTDYSAVYHEQPYSNVPPPYEQVYGPSSVEQQQHMFDHFTPGPSNPISHNPEQSSYSYYSHNTSEYMSSQQNEYETSMSTQQMYNGLDLNVGIPSMDAMDPSHHDINHAIPSTPQEHRYSMPSDNPYSLSQSRARAESAPQIFNHTQLQHHQVPTQNAPTVWPDGASYNSQPYSSWKSG